MGEKGKTHNRKHSKRKLYFSYLKKKNLFICLRSTHKYSLYNHLNHSQDNETWQPYKKKKKKTRQILQFLKRVCHWSNKQQRVTNPIMGNWDLSMSKADRSVSLVFGSPERMRKIRTLKNVGSAHQKQTLYGELRSWDKKQLLKPKPIWTPLMKLRALWKNPFLNRSLFCC